MPELHCGTWLCAGNLAGGERYALRPAALAQSKARAYMNGNATLRSGRAKVFWAIPRHVVPIKLKRASFSEMGTNAPLQNAHPAGAKSPPRIRISPMNGLDILNRSYSVSKN